MVLGCAFMYLREVGFALSLLLCGGGWGVCVCGLRVGGGVWCFPFQGSLGGFPSEGNRMGFLCLLKGGYGGPERNDSDRLQEQKFYRFFTNFRAKNGAKFRPK